MKIEGNKLTADTGYVLLRKGCDFNYGDTIYMGTADKLSDFIEGKAVTVDGLSYMMTKDSMTYDELTTALIRLRYTLDEELALMANLREDADGHKEEEAAFQEWRAKCKEAAREALGKKK